jgi:hypothetical protein
MTASLALGLFDDVPVTNQWKYTFEANELDVERLRCALNSMVDGDFWPLRGFECGSELRIAVRPDEADDEPMFALIDRADLSLSDVRTDAQLAHALVLRPWFATARVLRMRVIQLSDGHLLGVNISHAFADAHTYFRLFFAKLAAVYSDRAFNVDILNDRTAMIPRVNSTSPLPSHFVVVSRSLFPKKPTPMPVEHPQKTPGGSVNVRQLLHISGNNLRSLVARIGCETRLQALYAIVWKALGTAQIIFPADLRENERRWSPVIPFGYVGNPLIVLGCRCDDIVSTDVATLARLFKAAVDACTFENNAATLASFGGVMQSGQNVISVPVGATCAGITSWLRCDIRPMFGTARPQCLWSAPQYYRNLIQITDGDDGGVDVHMHADQVASVENVIRACLQI